ncbi:MAG: FixH family protein [Pseudomonadota bacterium]
MTSMSFHSISGRHVLWALLAFFGVVTAVNGVMVWLAISSFSGLETVNAYQKGLRYNEALAMRAVQEQLGWEIGMTYDPDIGRIQVIYTDNRGHPINDLVVTAEIIRPTHRGHDQKISLHAQEPGLYGATVLLPLVGQWRVKITAERSDGTRFLMEQDLWQT